MAGDQSVVQEAVADLDHVPFLQAELLRHGGMNRGLRGIHFPRSEWCPSPSRGHLVEGRVLPPSPSPGPPPMGCADPLPGPCLPRSPSRERGLEVLNQPWHPLDSSSALARVEGNAPKLPPDPGRWTWAWPRAGGPPRRTQARPSRDSPACPCPATPAYEAPPRVLGVVRPGPRAPRRPCAGPRGAQRSPHGQGSRSAVRSTRHAVPAAARPRRALAASLVASACRPPDPPRPWGACRPAVSRQTMESKHDRNLIQPVDRPEVGCPGESPGSARPGPAQEISDGPASGNRPGPSGGRAPGGSRPRQPLSPPRSTLAPPGRGPARTKGPPRHGEGR